MWVCAIDATLTWSWHYNDRNSLAMKGMTRNCARHIFFQSNARRLPTWQSRTRAQHPQRWTERERGKHILFYLFWAWLKHFYLSSRSCDAGVRRETMTLLCSRHGGGTWRSWAYGNVRGRRRRPQWAEKWKFAKSLNTNNHLNVINL